MERTVTYAVAAELLGAYDKRRIVPLAPKGRHAIRFDLEDECDKLARSLADDPERDLSNVSPELLTLFRARLLFIFGVCRLTPNEVIGRAPAEASDYDVLRALLGVQVAATRLPPEWRIQ